MIPRALLAKALGVCILSAIHVACGGGAPDGPLVLRTDSAGVEIILNQGPTWARGERWRLSRRPVVSIGDSENDDRYLFAYVSDAYRLPDGRIAVVDGQVAEIKLYDPDGEYLRMLGRRGEGPGEFQSPGRLRGYPGDSILISDFSGYRYLVFDSEEVFGRAMQAYELLMYWPQEGEVRPSGGMVFEGAFSDGSLLLWYPEVTRTTGSGMRRGMVHLVRLSPDGTAVDTLTVYPGGRKYPEYGNRIPAAEHFSLQVSVAVHRDEVFIGNGEEFRIDVLDPEGTLKRSIRVVGPNPPLTEALKESHEEFEVRRAGSSREAPSGMLEYMLSLPYPERLPAFYRILADELGNLWVGHWPEEEFSFNPERYTVFDRSGTMLGSVDFPPGFRTMQIGEDFVLGTWRDEYDVDHVHLYDLVKPEGSL